MQVLKSLKAAYTPWMAEEFMMDFEPAMWAGTSVVFPQVIHSFIFLVVKKHKISGRVSFCEDQGNIKDPTDRPKK